ncbi:MAG: succinate dehydrogenase cytochrome b subunit [Rikenellaceae bacterium]
MSSFLINSSIGKKLVMSLSGLFLILFILFHMSMNIVAIFSGEAYNFICAFLGANWYALAATAVLAAGVVVHFAYAIILTLNNYAARGNIRYEVTVKEKGVSWASKNMLVLGYVIVGGLLLHLVNFWAKMQLVEVLHFGSGADHHSITNSLGLHPTDGAALIKYTFSKWYFSLAYLVWFVALWFHLTHGVWSMFQSAGFANDTWFPRLKCIANIIATLIFLGFAVVVVYFFIATNFCPSSAAAAASCCGAH